MDIAPPARRPAPSDLARLTAADGIRALRAGRLRSEAWVEACLERIAARNDTVRAWVHVAADAALARARAVDRDGPQALFDGVPLGLKDTIDTADMPTEWGEPEIFPGRQPVQDAPVVAMARRLGFAILGKNTVSRHAIMLPGPCRNPHDPTRSPAASSAGSGAAVADFMAPISIGTQTAGSILRPASFSGAVGFKPTLDAIPYVGIRTYSRPLDVIGPLTRSVEDAMLFMRGFTGDPRFDVEAAMPGRLRIGVWRPAALAEAEPFMQDFFERQLRRLAHAGFTVTPLDMPAGFERIGAEQDVIMAYDLAREYDAIRRNHPEKCDPALLDYLALGDTYSAADYAAALDAADRCRRLFLDAARDVDLLVMPATLGEATPIADTGSSVFIRIWSLLHNPSLSLPVERGPNHLPVALQLVGFRGEDARFLQAARRVEAVLGNRAGEV
ncbi:amidase [Pseudoroseomonas cervicalis]|uniref:amidase n=1 Tax=Teichococcus cervicalis TaxID=204525 RepID=UPI0022F14732|nr:amidase [Pseudoroseomonas cervicalis]WBV44352.1 amidase [Pseudoroseomonas cervicalis]